MKYEMANKNVEKPKAETKEALRVMISLRMYLWLHTFETRAWRVKFYLSIVLIIAG